MSESAALYGVSYIASAPEELKVGDMVEVVDASDEFEKRFLHRQGRVANPTTPDGCNPYPDKIWVDFNGIRIFYFSPNQLRKLPDAISFEDEFVSARSEKDSDNVKAFKAILNEMADIYKAKDADYGSAYDDGYRLFGHTQLLSRIYEKFSRVKHMLDGNKPHVAENIYDTLLDMSIQCIALRMLLQKNDFENVD